MEVNRIEKHQIKKNSDYWKIIDELCYKSKNLYNSANYILRQEFINNNKRIFYNDMASILKDSEQYRDLGSNVGQQTLKLLDKNWKSFFKGIKQWSKSKGEGYLGKPKLPKYKNKDGRVLLIIDNIKSHIEDDYIRFSWKPLKKLNNKFKSKIKGRLMHIRFIPRGSDYMMEVVYKTGIPEIINGEIRNIIGIDLGVSNFATIGNNIGIKPIIINGKSVKSINQYYNKKKAILSSELKLKHDKRWSNRLQKLTTKRNNKIDDFIHKSSRYTIIYCLKNNIDTVIIGKNEGWKQDCNIGRKNNQNFTSIPHDLFIQKLQYKCEDCGIKFIITEENYTSKASFIDGDKMTKDTIFKGKRIKRGLYRSKNRTLINADLNASYNIIKKVVPEFNYDGIEGVGLHPVRVNTI